MSARSFGTEVSQDDVNFISDCGEYENHYSLVLQRYGSLLRGHLVPHDLNVPIQARIIRIFMQRAGEPAIGEGQIPTHAMASGVHGCKGALCLGVVVIRGCCQILLRAGAIRSDAAGSVQIFLTFEKHAVFGGIRRIRHCCRGFR